MRSKRLFEAAVRDHYSKMLVSVTLCSEPLYSVSLCIVHGYARVHTSIYICRKREIETKSETERERKSEVCKPDPIAHIHICNI